MNFSFYQFTIYTITFIVLTKTKPKARKAIRKNNNYNKNKTIIITTTVNNLIRLSFCKLILKNKKKNKLNRTLQVSNQTRKQRIRWKCFACLNLVINYWFCINWKVLNFADNCVDRLLFENIRNIFFCFLNTTTNTHTLKLTAIMSTNMSIDKLTYIYTHLL